QAWTEFELSLAVLDRAGVIDRLLTIEAAPLPAQRTTLKLFEIPDTDCEGIGAVILREIPRCAGSEGTIEDCYAPVERSSLARAPLVQWVTGNGGARVRALLDRCGRASRGTARRAVALVDSADCCEDAAGHSCASWRTRPRCRASCL